MIVRNDLHKSKLIVGCTRDSQIHVGAIAFQLYAAGLHDKLISRAEAEFMVLCGFGDAWLMLLGQAPIFGIDENGVPCFVEGGIAHPPKPSEAPAESAAVMDAATPEAPKP